MGRYLGCIGQPVRQPEFGFQNVIDAADDEGNDWLRRVVDATDLTHLGIIRSQECLVEMKYRVISPDFGMELFDD